MSEVENSTNNQPFCIYGGYTGMDERQYCRARQRPAPACRDGRKQERIVVERKHCQPVVIDGAVPDDEWQEQRQRRGASGEGEAAAAGVVV
jgi:hypothetical protein